MNGNQTLHIPSDASNRLSSSEGQSSILESQYLDDSNWQLMLDIRAGSNSLLFTGIGMNPEATVERDFVDISIPPTLGGTVLNVSEISTGLNRNIVNPSNGYLWDFKINNTGSDVTIRWDRSILSNIDLPVLLLIPETDEFVDMKKTDEVKLDKSVQGIKILFGNVEGLNSGLFTNIYPNPSDGRVSLDVVDLDNNMEEKEYVLELYGLDGQLKHQEVYLNGKTAFNMTVDNLTLSSGVYLYSVKTKTTKTSLRKLIVE